MGLDKEKRSNICPLPPDSKKNTKRHQRPRSIIMAVGLTAILTSTALISLMMQSPIVVVPPSDVHNFDQQDVFILHMDENCHLQWNLTFGGPWNDRPRSLVKVSTGGYVIASLQIEGFISPGSFGFARLWLTHIDEGGRTIWDRTLGRVNLYYPTISMIERKEGGFAIFCTNASADNENYETSILIINQEGTQERVLPVEGPGSYGFIECSDGGFAYGGMHYGMGTWTVITRIDANGNTLWDKGYYDTEYGSSHGNVIGDINGGFTFTIGGTLYRTDSQGNVTWSQYYEQLEGHTSITQCSNGDYLLTTNSDSPSSLTRINREGDILWHLERSYLDIYQCEETAKERFILLAKLYSNESSLDHGVILECIDANGNHLWNYTIDFDHTYYPHICGQELVTSNDGGFTLVGSENPLILAAALNNILKASSTFIPNAKSMLIVIALIGNISLIIAVVHVIVVKKPLLTK
jgi:hypothetical protein